MQDDPLPLFYKTPIEWATQVLRAPLELLNDHAHLEKKAAANALELLNRWPEPRPPENWVAAMTAIARDEVEHLAVVCRLLARRGGKLTKQHTNPYARALRDLVRRGEGREELVDRLLVSALIEARSCERFKLLGEACGNSNPDLADPSVADPELARLYRGLWASEHGHYRTFLQLAKEIDAEEAVEARWYQMREEEGKIIASQPTSTRMHSGTGSLIHSAADGSKVRPI